MNEQTGPILHWAEEYGQGRELTSNEVTAWLRLSLFVFAAAAILALVIINNIRAWMGLALTWRSVLSDPLSLAAVSACLTFLFKFIPFLVKALRSERRIETYAPPQPEPAQLPSPWRPPIPHHSQAGTNLIDMNERPALPDGRETGLSLNEPTVAAILHEIVTKHDGLWSRERLTAIKIGGERVTRNIYETLTHQLCQSGFLQERPRGGFKIDDEIELETYFPSLQLSRQAGRQAGGPERGGDKVNPPPGRGVTLAERRRQRFLECGCDVRDYLEGGER
jgi:hypothetical protein